MALTKIGSIGINTGIQLAGVTTIATLNASDNTLSVGGTVNFVSDVSIGGTVSIAGTLTYEDVTNVDSVGIITARSEIKVGSGITLSKDGDIFATGVSTFQSAKVTSLDVTAGLGIAESLFHLGDTDTRVAFPGDDQISFDTAGTQRMIIGSAGAISIVDQIKHIGDGDTMIRFPDADTFTVETAGSEAARIDSSGRLGIGTISPSYPLDIHDGSGTVNAMLRTSSTGSSDNTIFRMRIGATAASNYIYFGDTDDANAGQIRYNHGSNFMSFTTNASEAARIESNGKLLINHTTARGVGGSTSRLLQVEGTAGESAISVVRNSNNASGAGINLGKSRASSTGGTTIVQSGDKLGVISFAGADGVDLLTNAAQISGEVDGTPGENDMPGRIVFKTTADGASSSSERMRLTKDGRLGIGQNSPAALLHLSSGTSGDCELIIEADTDNNEEGDNPRILFRQDGGNDQNAIGIGGTVYDASTDNALYLMNSVGTSGGIIFATNNTGGYSESVARLSIQTDGKYKDHKSGVSAVNTLTNVPCWFGRQDSVQQIGTSAWTTIVNLGNNVVNQSNGGWNESNGLFTVPSGCEGTYYVYGQAAIDDVMDNDIVRCGFSVNDGTVALYSQQRCLDQGSNVILNSGVCVMLVSLSAGDNIKMQVYHNEGNTQPTETIYTFFGGYRIAAG